MMNKLIRYSHNELLRAIRASWTRETSVSPDKWSSAIPSTGQCAVTSLVLQDFLGGSITRCNIEGDGSHYWLLLDDGQEIDITSAQFGGGEIRTDISTVTRKKLLENLDTKTRYEALLQKVTDLIESRPRDPRLKSIRR